MNKREGCPWCSEGVPRNARGHHDIGDGKSGHQLMCFEEVQCTTKLTTCIENAEKSTDAAPCVQKTAETSDCELKERINELEDWAVSEIGRLREDLVRCRHQASYSIGDSEALANQLNKIREIVNESLTYNSAAYHSLNNKLRGDA